MEGLNYHHLFYFYTVARLGTIARASEQLKLTQPTISEQLRLLEKSLGTRLFGRSGRNLVLTEAGHKTLQYAEKIFALGNELTGSLRGEVPSPEKPVVKIGVVPGVSVAIVARLLRPLMATGEIGIHCHRDRAEVLLSQLATRESDFVLADEPYSRSVSGAYAHKLGQCTIIFMCPESLVKKYKRHFPESLNRAPVFVPSRGCALRRAIEGWFEKNKVKPEIAGEFDDLALAAGIGTVLFPAPSVITRELQRAHSVRLVAETDIQASFYLISRERKLNTPAAIAVSNSGRMLFR